MIISHSRKFIFIHGRKTAGSSIGISLMRYLQSGDVVRGYITGGLRHKVYPPDWNRSLICLRPKDLVSSNARVRAYRRYVYKRHGVSSTHMSARAIRELIGASKWDSYYKFTFERNPYDRLISFYFWRTHAVSNPPSFKKFLKAMHAGDQEWLNRNNLNDFSNFPLYTIDGQIAVDFVGSYENLQADLNRICGKIGIDFDQWLPKDKAGIRPKKIRHSDLYDAENIDLVRMIFSQEIELFGYDYTT